MKVLREMTSIIKTVLGSQEFNCGDLYRPISFCHLEHIDGKNIVYNILTGEISELNDAEKYIITSDFVKITRDEKDLVSNWYLVPYEHDDIQLADEVLAFSKLFEKVDGIKSYTIFSTMTCNARCFYCYENGRKKTHMSADTAQATAEFIIANAPKSKNATLTWFGGEPLCNIEAIDIITDALRNAGINFSSRIISNSYLFDDALIKKAVEDWNLKFAQVTLDGTETVYNNAKAYVNAENTNPFIKVINNIEKLLENGIHVSARMNIGEHNRENLFELADFLAERYSGRKGFSVYAHLLLAYNEGASNAVHLSAAENLVELNNYFEKKGLLQLKKEITPGVQGNKCMADSKSAITVLPDGSLGKCEHFTDSNFIGNVYDGITDTCTEQAFSKRANNKEICKGCFAYPACIMLENCPDDNLVLCNEAKRLIKTDGIKRNLIYTYKKIKEKEQKES